MITTYVVGEYGPSDKTTKIIFTNEEGLVHERTINIPKLEDGSVDEDYLQEIIDGQYYGVENKERIGVISFIDPNNLTGVAATTIYEGMPTDYVGVGTTG